MSTRQHNAWFSIREPLAPGKQKLLTLLSFLGPILTWCFVSYVPFVWHPDMKLDLSATRSDVTTVFTAGDHLSKAYFPSFVKAIREDNERILQQQQGELPVDEPAPRVRRSNLNNLRHLTPLALKQGWLHSSEKDDTEALLTLWQRIASAPRGDRSFRVLSEENLAIIRSNSERINAHYASGDSQRLPSMPLLKLVPQGRPANPVYLPAPHEVLQRGWKEFTKVPDAGKPSMLDRLRHSIWIVFAGFALACVIGVPLGILCGTFDFFSKLFEPFIDFFRYLPAPSFSTLLVAIFLAHDAPKIALVFVGTFFQLVLVVSKTTQLLDKSLLEAALTLGAGKKSLLTRVVVPGILPNLYNDLRILLGWSWTWLVIAELIGVKSGLTEFIETQGRWRNFDAVFPVIFTIGFVGFFTDQLLAQLRGFFFPWTGEKLHPVIRCLSAAHHWLVGNRLPYEPGSQIRSRR